MIVAPTRLATRPLLIGLAFAAAFVVLFWPTFAWMAGRFDAHDSFYSHGWIIPFASAWIVWRRRDLLKRLTPRADSQGLALLIPAAAIHVLASWWGINFVSGFAMVAAVWGVVWTLWGRETLWTLRFPMLFLLFMVPLPGVLLISISFYMKLFAATMATHVLTFAGMPVVQEGSTMHVPGVTVIVDNTCSGLRSVISLIALSTIWTTLMPSSSTRWQKLALVAAAIPIALTANMVRILAMVLLAAIYGTKVADSFLHFGSGIVVFGIALLVLAWLSRTLVGESKNGDVSIVPPGARA